MATSEAFSESNILKYISYEYHAKWKLTDLLDLKNKKIQSPAFSPVPNLDLQFCYEAYYEIHSSPYHNNNYGYTHSTFKSSLVKLDSRGVPPSMMLEVDMKVKYLNGCLFKEYRDSPIVRLQTTDCFYFEDVVTEYARDTILQEHAINIGACASLIVECQMKFFDVGAISFCPRDFCSLKTLNISAEDIKSLNRTDDKSDVVVRVGGKSFLAHKAVLAAYSPVFKKMLSEDSKHSTGSITVSNSTSEVFNLFLDYLYSGDFDYKSWTTLKDLYVLSVKYEVSALKEACSAAIISLLSVSNIFDVLGIAYDYGDVILKDKVTKFLAKHVSLI